MSRLTMASPRPLAACLSSWRTRCSVGRRLMRAAAIDGGSGMMPMRLMPRLTQLKKVSISSAVLSRTRCTMSHSTSITAMMLPMIGNEPATFLSTSSVT